MRPQRPSAHHLVHLDRGVEPFDGRRPQRLELEVALAQSLRRLTGRYRSRRRRGLHPRREIRHMTDRRVFRMAAGLDRPHHHFARVDPHAGFNRNLALCAQTVGIATQLLLHRQGGVQCSLRMVLVRDGRAEQGENPVAGGLRDIAAVAMHRRHHKLQHRVDDRARLLGIEIAHQLSRALDVGEQRGDGLTLAVGYVVRFKWSAEGDIVLFRSRGLVCSREPCRRGGGYERSRTLDAELCGRSI